MQPPHPPRPAPVQRAAARPSQVIAWRIAQLAGQQGARQRRRQRRAQSPSSLPPCSLSRPQHGAHQGGRQVIGRAGAGGQGDGAAAGAVAGGPLPRPAGAFPPAPLPRSLAAAPCALMAAPRLRWGRRSGRDACAPGLPRMHSPLPVTAALPRPPPRRDCLPAILPPTLNPTPRALGSADVGMTAVCQCRSLQSLHPLL